MNVSENIRLLREAKGMSQEELAEASRLPLVLIVGYESCETEPSRVALGKLAYALGVTVEDLTAETNSEAEAPAPATRSAQREKVCSLLVAQMELIAEKSRDDRGVWEEDLARLSDAMSILAQSLLNWEGGEGAE